MTAFLLAISLLLNIIALLAIILLYLRQNKLMHTEKRQEKVLVEMEEVISSYLIQMKEENDDFISKFSQINAKNDPAIKEKSIPVNMNRKNDQDIAKADEKSMRLARASIYQASKAYKQNLREAQDKLSEKESLSSLKETESIIQSDSSQSIKEENPSSINDKVFILKKQGMSAGDIAKKLGKGKTEVELMLKFRQNQQE
ncbi:hypothetical protein ABE29_04485 [Cytobacillus firmus]|uniref:DUF6115 domain-containing protein n=1 Tax=Cytobacillus firmus TaxID=1399 RepID=UPI00077CA5BB|nr:hypothetical protein [Cytobacillus firmus]MBG9542097.1 hypothetical protein [Cytobacillus firmus]MBG9551589.1 hypothetical protein [Cytobacillus firmus]MBG9556616.1 hypothetical protein [Cytobacillus firmus]MBG9576007.1 hypothetical protein [Cytobacillus firmus]MEC1892796.1 hypothetical protein [Cytobacillus firmus]